MDAFRQRRKPVKAVYVVYKSYLGVVPGCKCRDEELPVRSFGEQQLPGCLFDQRSRRTLSPVTHHLPELSLCGIELLPSPRVVLIEPNVVVSALAPGAFGQRDLMARWLFVHDVSTGDRSQIR